MHGNLPRFTTRANDISISTLHSGNGDTQSQASSIIHTCSCWDEEIPNPNIECFA